MRPVEPGLSSFMFACWLPLTESTNGRPNAGPSVLSTLTAANKASASSWLSADPEDSQSGWNSTVQVERDVLAT